MNNISTLLTAPWAIEPNRLIEIQAIYSTHLRGGLPDIAAIEKKLGRSLSNEPKPFNIVDGVAVIPLDGVIAKRMNMLHQVSGGTSSQLAAKALQTALDDPSVHSIILSIDSPGGTVDGTQALADAVHQARTIKPIVALADGMMASAAYWIGSAAQAIYITDATTVVGSIGVVASHTDISGAQASQGIKTTEISAGKYKRIASSYAPLSADGRQTIQDQVDYTYSLFVDAVAKNRAVSTDQVLRNMADGRLFIGQQAITAGLVDGFSTLDGMVAKLNHNRKTGSSSFAVNEVKPMTRTELDQAAKAHMVDNPGVCYLDAVKFISPELL